MVKISSSGTTLIYMNSTVVHNKDYYDLLEMRDFFLLIRTMDDENAYNRQKELQSFGP